MDITILFSILLFLKKNTIIKLLSNTNNEYLWRLLINRDNHTNKIIKSYYNSYILYNNLIQIGTSMGKYMTMHQANIITRIEQILSHSLTQVPTEIRICLSLRKLIITNNNIRNISSEIGKCINLQYVNIARNRIQTIPSEIFNCLKLHFFDIGNNHIQNIPTEIGNCRNLKEFYVDNNKIRNIPSEIGNCIILQYLDISSNQIKNIPTEIGNCVKIIKFSSLL